MGIAMLAALSDFTFLIPIALVVILAILLFVWSFKD